jgi:hypothetical protein
MMNTYNLKLNKKTINKLSTGNYKISGYDQDNNILLEPTYIKEINLILDILNPLSLDERYKVLEDLKVSLDEIEGNDLGI